MRTRVNFDIRVVKWKGTTHRVLVMRGDLSKRDSDGLLGVRRDALLLPRDASNNAIVEPDIPKKNKTNSGHKNTCTGDFNSYINFVF